MENFLHKINENTSCALGVKPQKKYNKFGILKNTSSKKFGTGIYHNKTSYQKRNSLLSNKLKSVFNHKTSSKKDLNKENSLTNSNIIFKSSEKKLTSNTNLKQNENSVISSGHKLGGTLIKKTVKFFQKILAKEKEINNEDIFTHLNSYKTEKSKLIKDIEKENNKIRSKI